MSKKAKAKARELALRQKQEGKIKSHRFFEERVAGDGELQKPVVGSKVTAEDLKPMGIGKNPENLVLEEDRTDFDNGRRR